MPKHPITRRSLLRGALLGVAVVGFDVATGRWIPANAANATDFGDLPVLDGTLFLDPATLSRNADDLGMLIQRRPGAVLRPGSVQDVAAMIRYCRRRGIAVAARGTGHSTYGQSLVDGGLVVDTSPLSGVRVVAPDRAVVGAGTTWADVVDVCVAQGLTPPVLTSYLGLSVGGTLAMGGVGARNREGLQIDRVRELEVVTGVGRVVRCSMERRRDLFEAMLGGLGQCGVVVEATLELEPAPNRVRSLLITYTSYPDLFRDLRLLTRRNELDGCFVVWAPPGPGLSMYPQIQALAFYDDGTPPDQDRLLRGLRRQPVPVAVEDRTYLEWALLYDRLLPLLRLADYDRLAKPWYDVWLSDSAVERIVTEQVASLDRLADLGPGGIMLLYAQRRSQLTRPFLRLPPDDGREWVYLFDILGTNARPGHDEAYAARTMKRNRRLFEQARTTGATRYPIGALDFDPNDWRDHYGPVWSRFRAAKRRYDPDNVLTPGPGIFP